jgi:DNA-binding MarR family transcriptional regulator
MQPKDNGNLFVQSPRLNKLKILREIASDARITQAELAGRCSLSVAMVNNYMKDLCRSGLLEYRRKSIKNITYYLTPSGCREMDALQNDLTGEMASMFANAKEHIRNRIMEQAVTVLRRVVLYGTGDLAQLAFHALTFSGVCILAVCDDNPATRGMDFCGCEVVSPSRIPFFAPDAVVVAAAPVTGKFLENQQALTERGIEIVRLDSTLETVAVPSLSGPGAAFDKARVSRAESW